MLLVVHPDKTVTTIGENVNVGDTATQLIVISPFSGIQTVSLHYKLPDGSEMEPAFATYAEGYPLGNGYTGNVYVMSIPPDMTEHPGTVQAMISFVDTNARRMVSDVVTITVGGFTVGPIADSEADGLSFEAQLEAMLASAQSFLNEYNNGTYREYLDNAIADYFPVFVGLANGANITTQTFQFSAQKSVMIIPTYINSSGGFVGDSIIIPHTLFSTGGTFYAKSAFYNALITLDVTVSEDGLHDALTVSASSSEIPSDGNYRLMVYNGTTYF